MMYFDVGRCFLCEVLPSGLYACPSMGNIQTFLWTHRIPLAIPSMDPWMQFVSMQARPPVSKRPPFASAFVRQPRSVASGGRRPGATQQQQHQHACSTTHANATNQLLEAIDAAFAPAAVSVPVPRCLPGLPAVLQSAAARGESRHLLQE